MEYMHTVKIMSIGASACEIPEMDFNGNLYWWGLQYKLLGEFNFVYVCPT
jgi:hypothetical protein